MPSFQMKGKTMEGNLIFFLIIRQSPMLRRLCGWESVAEVPSESTVSRAYDQFAQDQIASLVHAIS